MRFGLHMPPSSRPTSTSKCLRSCPARKFLWGSIRSTERQILADIVRYVSYRSPTSLPASKGFQCSPGAPVKCNLEESSVVNFQVSACTIEFKALRKTLDVTTVYVHSSFEKPISLEDHPVLSGCLDLWNPQDTEVAFRIMSLPSLVLVEVAWGSTQLRQYIENGSSHNSHCRWVPNFMLLILYIDWSLPLAQTIQPVSLHSLKIEFADITTPHCTQLLPQCFTLWRRSDVDLPHSLASSCKGVQPHS